MNDFYNELERLLKENKKEDAVTLTVKAFEEGLNPIDFYQDGVRTILNRIDCKDDDYACIWLEHQMSAIVRTLIELSYQYLIQSIEPIKKTKHVLVVCPKDEHHELGALIGAHFFTKAGFKTTFIGANTPLDTIHSALDTLTIDYVVLSVSNSYHLVETKKVVSHIKDHFKTVKVIGAGRGFTLNEDYFSSLLDGIVNDYASILTFKVEEGL